ncbi:MAG: glycosyltransferase family protein [Ignavibacteriaceae bacterium]
MAKNFYQFGSEVHVITVKRKNTKNIVGVNLHSTFGSIIFNFNKKNNNFNSSGQNRSYFRKIFSKIVKSIFIKIKNFWRYIYWPDYACLWYFHSIIKIRKVIRTFGPNDFIISVSLPFTGHLIALSAMKFNNKPKWIVDIGDPFSFISGVNVNNNKLYKNINLKIENLILRRCSKVSVTTENTLLEYKRIFPCVEKKISVIQPMLTITKTNLSNFPKLINVKNNIILTYIGTLYKNIRNPKYLINLFEFLVKEMHIINVELHFIGNINDCWDEFNKYQTLIGNKIFVHGEITKEETIIKMNESDILINIGNSNKVQIPSKIIEYISTGKPIINFVKHFDDLSIDFLREYPSNLNIWENEEYEVNITKCNLIDFIQNPKKRIEDYKIEQLTKKYSQDVIFDKYLQIMGINKNLVHSL